jgi:type IV pilus assembly protein PilB
MSGKLGEILLRENLITPDQLHQALEHQKTNGGRLASSLVKLGFLNDDEVTAVLSRQYGVPSIDLAYFKVDPSVTNLIPMETATKYQVLPLCRVGSSLTLAMVDPTNVFAMDDIKFMTGFNIEPVVASEAAIMEAIKKHYGSAEDQVRKKERKEIVNFIDEGQAESLELEAEEGGTLNLEQLETAAEEAPVIKLVNYILTDALKRGASDIHMEPYEKEYRVRYRIDGLLQTIMNPPFKLRHGIINRVKTMSNLNLLDKRQPQDGRIMVKMMQDGKKKRIDFSVTMIPTLWGEKLILHRRQDPMALRDLARLGFEQESFNRFQKAISQREGWILVAGPPASGKTTVLYAALAHLHLNKPDVQIITVDETVEFYIPGINQVQMPHGLNRNPAARLRSMLKHDADIILTGEISDFEAAEGAIKLVATGHLVLSTLHANEAALAPQRLMNMGIKPHLIANTVILICAPRVVRRICQDCKALEEVSPRLLIDAGYTPEEAETLRVYKGAGCSTCGNAGYKGRVGLYETLEMTDELREPTLLEASPELRMKAVEQGMISLRRSGLIKVAMGRTTLSQVLLETPC